MDDLEGKLRGLLTRVQDIPKTDRERMYLECLLVQYVSGKMLLDRVAKSYKDLAPLITIMNTGNQIETLRWLERNPLPETHYKLLESLRDLQVPDELKDLNQEVLDTLQEQCPTPLETWAFLEGAYVYSKTDNRRMLYMMASMQALLQLQGVLNAPT